VEAPPGKRRLVWQTCVRSSYHRATEGKVRVVGRTRFLLAAWVTVSSLALTTIVSAQTSDDDQAHAHFQVAASYYEQANYESALREFLEAYRLSQRSQLFYNLSLCYQQLGDLEHATDYLTRYLHDVTDIANRSSLETRLENLRTRLAAQHSGATPPPDTATETHPTETHPTESPTETHPTETHPTETHPTETPASGGDSLNVGAIAGFSVAAAGLILGAVFSGLTVAENSRVGGLPCAMTHTCTDSDLSTLHTDALVADIMWGLSLVGAGVGLVLLLVNPGASSHESTAQARLRVGPGSLSIEGTF
jgi:hypothetical protein